MDLKFIFLGFYCNGGLASNSVTIDTKTEGWLNTTTLYKSYKSTWTGGSGSEREFTKFHLEHYNEIKLQEFLLQSGQSVPIKVDKSDIVKEGYYANGTEWITPYYHCRQNERCTIAVSYLDKRWYPSFYSKNSIIKRHPKEHGDLHNWTVSRNQITHQFTMYCDRRLWINTILWKKLVKVYSSVSKQKKHDITDYNVLLPNSNELPNGIIGFKDLGLYDSLSLT